MDGKEVLSVVSMMITIIDFVLRMYERLVRKQKARKPSKRNKRKRKKRKRRKRKRK